VTDITEVPTAGASCRAARAQLGAYVRAESLSSRESRRLSGHLECCRDCTAIYLQLADGDHPRRVPRTSVPVRDLLGTTAAGVALGALVMSGLMLSGGGEGGGREPDPIAAQPFAIAPQAITGGGTLRQSRLSQPETPETASTEPGPTGTLQDPTPSDRPPHLAAPTQPTHHTTQPHPGGAQATEDSVETTDVAVLSQTQSGLVTVSADQVVGALGLDPICDLVSVGPATCRPRESTP
jgi:hypothetical protein